jgi:hypothetical protein
MPIIIHQVIYYQRFVNLIPLTPQAGESTLTAFGKDPFVAGLVMSKGEGITG